ncbi:choice-of-anchor I family protein [Spongiivirga sp. MCCC 1A20706]|uniref:choice-of-anchor I family protein n=1 Tax=Spongiivirga sp. MCCC 1A20706 TaxID=3160963 RepID=UPI003977D810
MKILYRLFAFALLFAVFACNRLDDFGGGGPKGNDPLAIDFEVRTTIQVGGEGAAEITAYDVINQKLFTVNVESNELSVFSIADIDNPIQLPSIDLSSYGAPNSVAIAKSIMAVAVEAPIKQDPGFVLLFSTKTQTLLNTFNVGALPDMVTFSPNGRYIVVANEGEPNDEYTIDPKGSISIINVYSGQVTDLTFDAFNSQEAILESNGFRVFGPGADLATDVEPEYITISKDSKTAWVSLQENNGLARVNLQAKQIEAIYPLGYKDYSIIGNEIDASDKDDKKELLNWPLYGMYQPDAIEYVNINGAEYIITANEGDARDYDGFSEEERADDLILDATVFPDAAVLLMEENLGRIKVTTTLGDTDDDGDYDEIYNYGARSFSIWSPDGSLLYDSGNDIALRTLDLTPDRFNDNDKRSDDKGAEPESVEVLNIKNKKWILFVGLERTDQTLVYDITDPLAPSFIEILSSPGDEAPEGLLAISANQSPTGKALLVVSNEDSGTVTIYENQ